VHTARSNDHHGAAVNGVQDCRRGRAVPRCDRAPRGGGQFCRPFRVQSLRKVLWIKARGVVGTHKHHGTVVMVCLEGSARYLEYDWVAGPAISSMRRRDWYTHRSVTVRGVSSCSGSKDPSTSSMIRRAARCVVHINHYKTYCRAHDIPINQQLYL
jgi:2,4'-dihydroxyacetophenone dioxygenase